MDKNIDMKPNVVNFEKRILELIKDFPKGVPDKILQNDQPDISASERAMAINNLLTDEKIEIYKQGTELLYKKKTLIVEPDSMKNADAEEKVVYDIIKESKNKGIWIREIRFKSNLTLPQTNKIVKSLENKKLIKAVKSVSASKKKVYMLYDIEPDRSLTGGSWYSDQDFESEFVSILNQQCLRYLKEKKDNAKTLIDEIGPRAARLKSMASLQELWEFISNLGISNVPLSKDDIECIMKTLIYDGKVQEVVRGGEGTLYLCVEPLSNISGMLCVPCGICPVAENCSERGVVNPKSCAYITKWISDELASNKTSAKTPAKNLKAIESSQ